MTLLQPGQTLGPYQIISQIGKGGMATVYKAYQPAMDRYVALKVVASQLTDDPTFMQRFRQEARLIAKLEHPHILPVHDFGEADRTPYLVMRFLEAGTLNERLDAGQLSVSEIDRIFTQLTEALEYAHENGVIHRDIKPSNAMLDRRGDVFLTDFGIAKIAEGSLGLTATGAITGTPSYMSPEQAQGIKVDQRSDIYSLGIVLFEMLTGRVPFEAETPMAVLFKQIQDPPPPLSIVRPDLPYQLEAVLLKALAKDPATRYASMGDFRAGWKRALAEAATLPPPQPVAPVQTSRPSVPVESSLPATTVSAFPTIAKTPVAKAPTEPPVKKPFNWKIPALGVGVVFCLGALFLASSFILNLNFSNPLPTNSLTNSPQVQSGTPSNAKPTLPGLLQSRGTEQPGSAPVTSWAAANSVYSIAFYGNEVLASGFGGVTIWQPDGSYKRVTTADGLPSANAGLVFVDQDQSVWVGTDGGLLHIEGDKRTVYTSDQGLDSHSISALFRHGEKLLAGTRYSGATGGGLLEFDGQRWQAVAGFPSTSRDTSDANTVSYDVQQITNDKDGNLWVATGVGVARQDAAGKWTVFKKANGLPDDNVYTVYQDRAGTIWAGTGDGGAAKFNPEKEAFERFADLKEQAIYDVYSILEDKDGNLWFTGGNVARYTPNTKQWMVYNADQGTLPVYSARSAAINDQGVLYFGTDESGLARYENGKIDILLVPDAPHYGEYGRIIPEPDGKLLFIQLYESGVDEYNPADGSWTKLHPDMHVPRAFDAQGRMWSGGWDSLWIFGADDKKTQVTSEHGLPSEQVNSIVFDADGMAYIATQAGIAIFDGLKVTTVYTTKDGLPSDEISTLFMASDGSLWVSATGWFGRRLPNGSWESFTSEKLFGGFSQYFPSFVEDSTGNIWVTTIGDGLYLFSNGKWSRMRSTDPGVGLPSDQLTRARLAPDGAIWIGTDGEGAVRYDGTTWTRYTVANGLLNNQVSDIYIDSNGAVWFTTSGGVTKLEQ